MTAHAPERTVGGGGARFLTADVVAGMVGGRVIGDGAATVTSIAPLDRATGEQLSFLASPAYADLFAMTSAAVVLVAPAFAELPASVRARVVIDKPHEAMLALLPVLYPAREKTASIHETARIGRGAQIGRDVIIGAYAVVGDGARIADRAEIGAHVVIDAGAEIGADTLIYSNVTVYSGTRVGQRCIVHAGVRLGSDGFGYVYQDGAHRKIPHVGRCIVGDDVEIGANTTIDRGSIDDTVIGAGTKIDNLVQIAHNVRIGKLCLIMAQVGIAGSVRVGDGVILAGQVGVSGHHEIGAGARLAAQAGVFGDIPAGETWSGYPARPHKEALRAQAALFKLAPLMRKLERLLERDS